MRRGLICIVLATCVLSGQSRLDLLRRVSNFYNGLDSFDIKGQATAKIAGANWQVAYDVETAAAQPRFVPLEVHSSKMQVVSTVGNFRKTRTVSTSSDPFPSRRVGMPVFARFTTDLTRKLLGAERVRIETVLYEGRGYSCEVVEAIYDTSPEFKPHSSTSKKRFWIDPATLWMLKEAVPSDAVGEWTFDVTSMAFDKGVPSLLVEGLKGSASQSKVRPNWVGRNIPNVMLRSLSGEPVNLASFRGEPTLIDFWASWCVTCRHSFALSEELGKTYQQAGLCVLSVTQDSTEDARAWQAFHHLSLPTLLDIDGSAFKAFEIPGVPVVILIDDRGAVVKYWVGVYDEADVQSTV